MKFDELETVILNSRRVGQRRLLAGEFMRETAKETLDPILGSLRDEMIYAIDTYVRTHNLPPDQITKSTTITFTTPASWWQHWKRDVAANTRCLRWITRRWPVTLTNEERTITLVVDLKRFRMYPDAPNFGDALWARVAIPSHEIFTEWRGR